MVLWEGQEPRELKEDPDLNLEKLRRLIKYGKRRTH